MTWLEADKWSTGLCYKHVEEAAGGFSETGRGGGDADDHGDGRGQEAVRARGRRGGIRMEERGGTPPRRYR